MVRINQDSKSGQTSPLNEGPSGSGKPFNLRSKTTTIDETSEIHKTRHIKSTDPTPMNPGLKEIIEALEKWDKDHKGKAIKEEDFVGVHKVGPPKVDILGLNDIRKMLNAEWQEPGTDQGKLGDIMRGIDGAYKLFYEADKPGDNDRAIRMAIYQACVNVDPNYK